LRLDEVENQLGGDRRVERRCAALEDVRAACAASGCAAAT